jgi:hypothetical protein
MKQNYLHKETQDVTDMHSETDLDTSCAQFGF